MGDRGTIKIEYDREYPPLYFYTHWRGSETTQIVRDALAKRWRWDDDAYLARIIFDELVGETGFGISSYPISGGPTVTVDVRKQTVRYPLDNGGEELETFEEFIALNLDSPKAQRRN